jgi:hypothetical protein
MRWQLVENIRSLTQKIDEMCSNAVTSVRATVAEDNKTPKTLAESSPTMKTRAQRAKAAKEKAGPEKQQTPVASVSGSSNRQRSFVSAVFGAVSYANLPVHILRCFRLACSDICQKARLQFIYFRTVKLP